MTNEAALSGKSGGGWFKVLMELYRVNEPYIQQVVDASRKILRLVLERLVPGGHLKHAPVRTCFRILSGMIFILKVCLLLTTLQTVLTLHRHSRWVRRKTMSVSHWISRTGQSKHSTRTSLTMYTSAILLRDYWSCSLRASEPVSCGLHRRIVPATVKGTIAQLHTWPPRRAASTAIQTIRGIQTTARITWGTSMETTRRARQ